MGSLNEIGFHKVLGGVARAQPGAEVGNAADYKRTSFTPYKVYRVTSPIRKHPSP
jgi:hypothetical protein